MSLVIKGREYHDGVTMCKKIADFLIYLIKYSHYFIFSQHPHNTVISDTLLVIKMCYVFNPQATTVVFIILCNNQMYRIINPSAFVGSFKNEGGI